MNKKLLVLFVLCLIQSICGMELPTENATKKQKQEVENPHSKFWEKCAKAPLAVARDVDQTLFEIKKFGVFDEPQNVALSPNGERYVAFTTHDGSLVIRSVETGAMLCSKRMPDLMLRELHWMDNETIALICTFGITLWCPKNDTMLKFPYAQECCLETNGLFSPAHVTAASTIVCKLHSKDFKNPFGFVAQYDYDELSGEINDGISRPVNEIFWAAITACEKYTAIVENARKPAQSMNSKKPKLFLCNNKKFCPALTHEPNADTIYVIEFSPGGTYLLSAEAEKGIHAVVSYHWEKDESKFSMTGNIKKEIISLFRILAPDQIHTIMWGKNLSASPYFFIKKDTAWKLDVEKAMWPLVGCDQKKSQKTKN